MAFKGRGTVRTKIVIDDKIMKQGKLFKSLGNLMSYEEELDIDSKLQNYLKITAILIMCLDHKNPLRKQE
jgi:hypothetical protein